MGGSPAFLPADWKVNAFYGELMRRGRMVSPVGPPSVYLLPPVHSVHVTIGKALGDAVRWGLLARNVVTLRARVAHPALNARSGALARCPPSSKPPGVVGSTPLGSWR